MARSRLLLLNSSLAALALMIGSCFAADLPLIAANDNRHAAGKLESGILTLRLEAREAEWHPGSPDGTSTIPEIPGTIRTFSLAEEGRAPEMPGPLIRVPQGSELRVSVHNLLSVSVIIHGLNQHPVNDETVIQLEPDEKKEVRFNSGELRCPHTRNNRSSGTWGPELVRNLWLSR